MTTAQLRILIELAFIVRAMAAPDAQRRIDQLFETLQDEVYKEPSEAGPLK